MNRLTLAFFGFVLTALLVTIMYGFYHLGFKHGSEECQWDHIGQTLEKAKMNLKKFK